MSRPAVALFAWLAAVPLTVAGRPASAGSDAAAGGSEAVPEVVIQASRTAVAAFDYPGSVSQVTADDLNALGATHSSEALNRAPGAFLQRGSGQEVLVALRSPILTGPGACGAFLVMEDGIALRPVGSCNVNELFEVNLEQAAGLEVLRGPGLGPQGANAVHGIVNVRSVSPDAPFRLGLEAGEDAYARVKVQGSTALGTGRVALAAHATHDGGWRDQAGFDEQKFNLKWAGRVGDGTLTLSAAGTQLDQETAGFIGGFESYKDPDIASSNANPEAFREASALRLVARWAQDAPEGWQVTAFARGSRMRFLQHFLLGKPLERNGQQGVGLAVQKGFSALGARWQLGLDGEVADSFLVEFQAGPTLEGAPAARAIRPAGFHYDYRVGTAALAPWLTVERELAPGWSLLGSLRAERTQYDYDNRMISGNTADNGTPCGVAGCLYARPADRKDSFTKVAPRLGLTWRATDSLAAWASVSRGFRPPEATELYRLQRQQQVADLDTETIAAAELGLRGRGPRATWSVAAFAMDKKDVILRDSSAFNISAGRTRHLGVELEGRFAVTDQLSLSGEATLARHTYRFSRAVEQGEQITSGDDVDTAPRRLQTLRARYAPVEAMALELEWVSVGPYYADAANTSRYPGHDLLNLRAAWSPVPAWSVALRITNLTDRAYADRADVAFGAWRYFPGRPRAAFIEVNWQP
jgi:iron complex outermembrane recepter protein